MTIAAPFTAAQVAPVRMPLSRARHALADIYADPNIYALEKERIFMREWLLVAREDELAQPGDYLTLRLLGEPVVLTRDKDGRLHAFANVCAHRGVEVAFGQGNRRSFSCPYHGWSYRLDGSLLGAPLIDGNEDFDRANCRLPELGLGVWDGNLFVNFAPDAQPFEEFIAAHRRDWDHLAQERCRLAAKFTVPLACNWKFAVENLLDIYHVRVLHAKTFGAQFDARAASVNLEPAGGVSYEYKAAPSAPGGKSLFGRMPWLGDDFDDSFGATFRMAPNTHMFARIDQIRYIVIWPTAPDRCELVCYHLFPEEFFAVPDFEARVQVYRDYQLEVLDEDRLMMDSLQRAMGSRHYRPGPMAGMELAIHHVLKDYFERLGIEPGATHAA